MDKHVLVTAKVGHGILVEPINAMFTLEKVFLETLKKHHKLDDYIIGETSNYIKKELEIINITERELNESEEYLANIKENKELNNE